MKRRALLHCLLPACLVATGCARKAEPEDRSAATEQAHERSTARTVVDGLTGRTAVRAGTNARNRIEAISAQQRQDLQEVMGEE